MCSNVRAAFAHRRLPSEVLRGDLYGTDAVDAAEFLEATRRGESAVTFFHSAIPYFTFLTDEAALFYFPDLLAIFAEDPVELLTVFQSLDVESGRRVLSKLNTSERAAICDLVDAMKQKHDHKLCQALLDHLRQMTDWPNMLPGTDALPGQ